MKSRLFSLLLALCLLLTVCSCDSAGISPSPSEEAPGSAAPAETAALQVSPTLELSQREVDWREDFDYLKKTLVEVHPDPFWCCPEENFDWKMEHLAARVSDLTDSEIYFELMQIVGELRDSHIVFGAAPFIYLDILPIDVRYFDGHLYLCGYIPGYDQLAPYLLREIVAINGIDITYILQRYSSCGQLNTWVDREQICSYLAVPAFLDMFGCGYQDGYTFQFLNENREVVSVEMPVLSENTYKILLARGGGQLKMIRPENWDSLLYLKEGRWAEYVPGENGGCVYMSISELLKGTRSYYSELIKETGEIVRSHEDCSKLVIDLRSCPGGDLTGIEQVWNLFPDLLAPWTEQIYVLTSGATGSAAITVLAECKDRLGAVIVGDPTGQFSNMFGFSYSPNYTLPNSQIMMMIPNMEYIGPEIREVQYDESGKWYEWENTILPDVFVPQDIEDIRQGKDSVIEWVLAQ